MKTEAQTPHFSLRKRVAWRLIPPLAIILLLNAFWSYKSAMDAANRAYDRSLTASLKSIAENIHATGGHISVDIPYTALDILEEGVQEHVYYAILGPGGEHLTGYDDLHPPHWRVGGEPPAMVDMALAIWLPPCCSRIARPRDTAPQTTRKPPRNVTQPDTSVMMFASIWFALLYMVSRPKVEVAAVSSGKIRCGA